MVCEVSGSTSLFLLSLLKLSNHEKALSTIHLWGSTVNFLAASGLSMFAARITTTGIELSVSM